MELCLIFHILPLKPRTTLISCVSFLWECASHNISVLWECHHMFHDHLDCFCRTSLILTWRVHFLFEGILVFFQIFINLALWYQCWDLFNSCPTLYYPISTILYTLGLRQTCMNLLFVFFPKNLILIRVVHLFIY